MNKCQQKRVCEGRHRKICIYNERNGFCIYEDQSSFLHLTPKNTDEKLYMVGEALEGKFYAGYRKLSENQSFIIESLNQMQVIMTQLLMSIKTLTDSTSNKTNLSVSEVMRDFSKSIHENQESSLLFSPKTSYCEHPEGDKANVEGEIKSPSEQEHDQSVDLEEIRHVSESTCENPESSLLACSKVKIDEYISSPKSIISSKKGGI